jgi:glycosyltransferase involved in cell wall biosynthesis
MKIGFMLPQLPDSLGGGPIFEQEIFECLTELCEESRHQFIGFTEREPPALTVSADKLKLIRFQRPGEPGILRRTLKLAGKVAGRILRANTGSQETQWLDRYMSEQGIDVFLCLNPSVRTRDVPFVTVLWDLQHRLQPFFPEVSSDGQWEARERNYSLLLRRCTVAIACNQQAKREIQTFYGVSDSRIRILPHPTPGFALKPPAQDDKQVLSRFQLPEPFLFYPAQFWPHKNHIGLLQALHILNEKGGRSLSLALTGADQGNEAHVRQCVAKLGLEESVFFLGFVSREELTALYRKSRALVFPSFFGPENLPPLEAFALGCPVIAARVPGSEEQLADAALLVDPTSETEIADAIHRVDNDQQLRDSLIAKGRIRATRFTGSDFVRGLFEIFDEFESFRRCWPGS